MLFHQRLVPVAFVVLAGAIVPRSSQAEEWTNIDGRALTADLISADATDATLKMADGKTYTIKLNTLSEESQARVKAFVAEKDKATSKPAKKSTEVSQRRSGRPAPSPDDKLNWDDEWPVDASADDNEVVAVKEDAEKGEFIYHSPHYEFVCDARLGTIVVRRFARLFESTLEYCKVLPISMQKPHNVGDRTERLRIELFKSKSDYAKAGGPPGSAGVYIGGRDVILVPLESLGVVASGKGFTLDYDKGNKTLPHEITHQLTDRWYYATGARGWFTEGLAEYIGTTPYNSGGGTFRIRTNRKALVEYVTAYGEDRNGGRALGKEIHMTPLRQWMLQSYSSFLDDAGKNYGVGALVAYYFFHMDEDGDRVAITNFLKALREGKEGEAALEALRNGRTWDELSDAITKGWRSKGVKLTWAPDPGESGA